MHEKRGINREEGNGRENDIGSVNEKGVPNFGISFRS